VHPVIDRRYESVSRNDERSQVDRYNGEELIGNLNMKHYNPESISKDNDFESYVIRIIHEWSGTLTTLAYTLVPIFFLLDCVTMPSHLLPRFGSYRLISTIIVLLQYVVIRKTRPSRLSYYHGYLVSLNIGLIISLMTKDLGGFNSAYYAGLNLVLIGVNLLLPWHPVHSAANAILIIVIYIAVNTIFPHDFTTSILINNLFFLLSTGVIAVSINHVKYRLVRQEFSLLLELKKARDAIWSEMELAKRIQTALLPDKERMKGFEIAATMVPAEEVGGDYYDIIETPSGEKWVAIGDVSGHGVDSGLIMMMAETSILSMVNNECECQPSAVLKAVNAVIRENLARLGSDHYMTLMAIHLNGRKATFAGKHQDVILYRAAFNKTEVLPTRGTWLGIADDIEKHLVDVSVGIDDGDIMLLFTDGITEASNAKGEMFGQARVERLLSQYYDLPPKKLLEKVIEEIKSFQQDQLDDMSLIVIKRRSETDG